MLSLTTGGPQEAYTKDGFNGDIMGVLRPIHRGILQFVGFDVLAPHTVYGPVRMSAEDRKKAFEMYADRLQHIFEEQPIQVGRY